MVNNEARTAIEGDSDGRSTSAAFDSLMVTCPRYARTVETP
jgi:hypothetical protein